MLPYFRAALFFGKGNHEIRYSESDTGKRDC